MSVAVIHKKPLQKLCLLVSVFYLLYFFSFLCLFLVLFVFVCFCFCWTFVHSNSPFWIFSLIMTCLFIFWEFEFGNFGDITYCVGDFNVVMMNVNTQQDIESCEQCRRAKGWCKFESRKGCRVISYVGFFGGFWMRFFRNFS